jgi:hypothetical protein
MDPRPRGVNGLKILSGTRLLVQTILPTRLQPSCRRLQHRSWVCVSPEVFASLRKPTRRGGGLHQGCC